MAKKNLEISLVSLSLASTGTTRKAETTHAVTAALVWPRVTIARRETAQSCTLAKGRADFSGAPWHETILFKETVDGRFALRVEVTEPLSALQLDSFLRTFAGILLKDVGTVFDKSDLLMGGVLSALFSTASKKTGTAPATAIVAAGTVSLDLADLHDGDEVDIPLTAPRALVESRSESSPNDRGRVRTSKTLLRKDAANGTVRVRIRIVG